MWQPVLLQVPLLFHQEHGESTLHGGAVAAPAGAAAAAEAGIESGGGTGTATSITGATAAAAVTAMVVMLLPTLLVPALLVSMQLVLLPMQTDGGASAVVAASADTITTVAIIVTAVMSVIVTAIECERAAAAETGMRKETETGIAIGVRTEEHARLPMAAMLLAHLPRMPLLLLTVEALPSVAQEQAQAQEQELVQEQGQADTGPAMVLLLSCGLRTGPAMVVVWLPALVRHRRRSSLLQGHRRPGPQAQRSRLHQHRTQLPRFQLSCPVLAHCRPRRTGEAKLRLALLVAEAVSAVRLGRGEPLLVLAATAAVLEQVQVLGATLGAAIADHVEQAEASTT